MCINKEKCKDYDPELDCDEVTCRWPTCFEAKEEAKPDTKENQ